MDTDVCPRCDIDVISYCSCGMDFNFHCPTIILGKYEVSFNSKKDQTRIGWNKIGDSYIVDVGATSRNLINVFGNNYWEDYENDPSRFDPKIIQQCKVYYPETGQDEIMLPGLRWKITEEQIEGLLLLR